MSDNKRYYWLKLGENFFEEDTVQWIEEQENGEKYVLFYLKLCLKSLINDGYLIRYVGERLIPYDVKALAKLTGVDIDTVAVALKAFEEIGLIERTDTGEIFMKQINEMIGTETDSAKRVRKHRAKEQMLQSNGKVLQSNSTVTKCNTEIDIDIEIDKDNIYSASDDTQNNSSTQKNSGTKQYSVFEKIWSMYPEKKGKGQVSKKSKEQIEKLGIEKMEKALQRYIDDVEKQRKQGFSSLM